jgi:hypothetical protein
MRPTTLSILEKSSVSVKETETSWELKEEEEQR